MPRGRPRSLDQDRVKQNIQFNKSRTQARYRNESWDLDFEQWLSIWGDQWQHRGKYSNSKCMIRIDRDGSWNTDNVEIVTRQQFLKRQKEK